MSPRDYLLDRFRTDALTLRERAAALRAGPKQPGPDAATSERMAGACDAVVAMITPIPEDADATALVAALLAMVPLLEKRAAGEAAHPPVRAVYIGAATRIREIAEAEARHAAGQPAVSPDESADDDDEEDNGARGHA